MPLTLRPEPSALGLVGRIGGASHVDTRNRRIDTKLNCWRKNSAFSVSRCVRTTSCFVLAYRGSSRPETALLVNASFGVELAVGPSHG
jgi:hypothetical protein